MRLLLAVLMMFSSPVIPGPYPHIVRPTPTVEYAEWYWPTINPRDSNCSVDTIQQPFDKLTIEIGDKTVRATLEVKSGILPNILLVKCASYTDDGRADTFFSSATEITNK